MMTLEEAIRIQREESLPDLYSDVYDPNPEETIKKLDEWNASQTLIISAAEKWAAIEWLYETMGGWCDERCPEHNKENDPPCSLMCHATPSRIGKYVDAYRKATHKPNEMHVTALICDNYGDHVVCICSNCGEYEMMKWYSYCWNCGAKIEAISVNKDKFNAFMEKKEAQWEKESAEFMQKCKEMASNKFNNAQEGEE